MKKQRTFSVLALFILVVSLAFGGNIPVVAQTPTPPPPGNGKSNEQQPRVTQAQRQAAADEAAKKGQTLPDPATADMAMPGAAPRYFSHPNYANSPLPGNVVSDWNAIAQNALQPMPMPGMPMPMGNISMATAFVYLTYTQTAVYNALLMVEGGYKPYTAVPNIKMFLPIVASDAPADAPKVSYKPKAVIDPTASREAAVATAAFRVLEHYLAADTALVASLLSKYEDTLSLIPPGPAKTAGIAIGEKAAADIIALRTGDGLLATGTYTVPAPGPGVWQPASMPGGGTVPPIDPWMAKLKPFTFDVPSQFRDLVGSPWALDSAEWAAQFNAVKQYGATSTVRTPEQTDIAMFWTTNNVIQFNAAYRDVAARESMDLLDTARLMAMGNMIGTDSLISCFDTKYEFNFWRPIGAIRNADTDGNPLTEADPTWMPLVMTPNHPEFVVGHSCFAAAQGEVFKAALGTDQINLNLDSLVTGKTRTYATAADLRTEVNNARLWAGIHYPGSTVLAEKLGLTVAKNALLRFFGIDPVSDTGQHMAISGGLRKFVDGLPGLGAANANNLDQYIPVGAADTTTYPDADYYEIAVVQYRKQLHSDLPPTLLRGYVQLSTSVVPGEHVQLFNDMLDGTRVPILIGGLPVYGVTEPNYLGPTIVATKDKPVRILFRNLLPTGVDGDLFIPTDTTVMGAGMGPDMYGMPEMDPLNPMCGVGYDMDGNRIPKEAGCYSENRATLHLHGGITPWISDGTPHQWITPAGDSTLYPKGVSVHNVPDMPDPGPGAMTFFYTNQQSARLMFYHDHAWGITRLNVYAGEAAGYIITDATEQALVTQGILPNAASTIPLIIQDKTFVPSKAQLAVSDETWDLARWGGAGNLWLPHVYSPAQNPGDSSGVNQYGRWAYGPWFWPPTQNVTNGPVPNPYYDPNCDTDTQWCEPEMMPGTPYNSMGMEAFNDTPMVNGTVYPTITLDPKTYRFRILNAAGDRFFNLHFYVAVDANGNACDINTNPNPVPEKSGVTCTEVALNAAEVAAALNDPAGVFPTPDLAKSAAGPSWVQFGTEGGFLPAPTVIPPQHITWVTDPTVFNAGNVLDHSLLVGPAERADVVVDFSAFAGKTLILYNDAPAAFPARDPRYDYYTGNPDLRDTGGAPSTLPGYGPNTRTVMQVKIAPNTPAPAYNVTALQTAFKATSLGGQGVFETSQHPIVVGQGAYNSAYGTNFRNSGLLDGFARITDFSLTFRTLANWQTNNTLTIPFKTKAIQDEMGEAFDPDYGRMSGNLGLELPLVPGTAQNLLLYGFALPPTEVLRGIELPAGVMLTPITSADDGTQLWKITHNGVDTHPIHFHLYDVQLINRVGWDGIIRPPDANELGWKDTVRISPLEDTIVALRPLIPTLPWDLPNSVRLIDPSMPEGVLLNKPAQILTDPVANPIQVYNVKVNFGWEYVWHCHILSHEEMDMMRPQSVGVRPKTPGSLAAVLAGDATSWQANLTWVDNSLNETAFIVQRAATIAGPWTDLASLPENSITYTDTLGAVATTFVYRVVAANTIGDTTVYAAPSIGFPTTTMLSEPSNMASIDTIPAADPTLLTATLEAGPQVKLDWVDNATDETGYVVERADNGGAFTALTTLPANTITYTDTTILTGNSYEYRVAAVKLVVFSGYSNIAAVVVPTPPADPTLLTATLEVGPQVKLDWVDNATDETGYVVERADNGGAFAVLTTLPANTITYTDTTVIAGGNYEYRVAAVNGVIPSGYSNTAAVAVPTLPADPTLLTATLEAGPQVKLDWVDNATNETGYVVERSLDGLVFAPLTTLPADTITYTDATVVAATSYYYRVAAVNPSGSSAWANALPAPVVVP